MSHCQRLLPQREYLIDVLRGHNLLDLLFIECLERIMIENRARRCVHRFFRLTSVRKPLILPRRHTSNTTLDLSSAAIVHFFSAIAKFKILRMFPNDFLLEFGIDVPRSSTYLIFFIRQQLLLLQ